MSVSLQDDVMQASPAGEACSGAEAFALQVLGSSMEPEFVEGNIVVIEPQGHLRDGSYVLAQVHGEWILRQLVRAGDGWQLHALNPAFPPHALVDLSAIHGVVIQQSVPGKRRLNKRYI